jgi:hypothetical protein
LTGNVCEEYEFGNRADELQALLDNFMLRPETATENAINAANPDLDIDEILELAKSSKNGADFTTLFSGSQTKYQSQSEADMALCSYLAFWTGKDAQKMDQLFRKSGLIREKWDRSQSSSTYGAITIRKAISYCTDVYTPRQEVKPDFSPLIPLTPQWSELPLFPVDALPDIVQKYVNAVATHSQTSTRRRK